MQSKRWVFTLNNYVPADITRLTELAESVEYIVYGRETGESGTPHLQGFVVFKSNHRLDAARNKISDRAHLEVARGTSKQASDYCKKDADFDEFGTLPGKQGNGCLWERFVAWCMEQEEAPSELDLVTNFPSLYGRYPQMCKHYIALLCPHPVLVEGALRPWQSSLSETLEGMPDDRSVIFVVDPLGGMGKSWFIKHQISKNPLTTQRLSIGKRDDLAYAINPECRVFLIDVPRTQSEFLRYEILEQLKDRMVFSPKYNSVNKVLKQQPHVVVFMNEEPDMNKMSGDRYQFIRPPLPVYNIPEADRN